MIYRLPAEPSRELAANLACLQDCVGENPAFRRDEARRRKVTAATKGKLKVSCCT